jgi:outer membrane biosynthesis protein TonB
MAFSHCQCVYGISRSFAITHSHQLLSGTEMAALQKPSYADALKTPADSKTSDFPSLSGGPQPASNAGQSSWNSNILRQPPAQQPQPIQQRAPQQPQQPQAPQPPQQQVQPPQQQQQQQRVPSATLSQQSTDQQEEQQVQQPSRNQSNGGGEEFPPLGVRTNGELFDQTNGHGGVTLRSPDGTDGSPNQGNGQHTQLPFREASNVPAQAQQAPIGHPLTQTTSQQVRICNFTSVSLC